MDWGIGGGATVGGDAGHVMAIFFEAEDKETFEFVETFLQLLG